MKVYAILFAVVAFAGGASLGAEHVWKDRTGKDVPDDPSRRSVSGFGGWLVVTPDANWEEKWNTPREVTPAFNTSDDVHLGETLNILIFYANPRVSARGTIEIRCDIKVIRPNGSTSVDEEKVVCASGSISGPASSLRLSENTLQYVGEQGDPLGKWTVNVTLYDVNAKLSLPLRTYFTLKSGGA